MWTSSDFVLTAKVHVEPKGLAGSVFVFFLVLPLDVGRAPALGLELGDFTRASCP